VQVPRGSGLVRDLDIIVLDTPRGEMIEISSSSCDPSIFFLEGWFSSYQRHGGHAWGVIEYEHRGTVV
jgi:hypothetical protein